MSFPVADTLLARSIPFVLLSGFVSLDLSRPYRHCRLLSKPVRSGKLLEFLRQL